MEDLDLMDSFLFSVSTEKIQDAEIIARVIVERATGQKLGKVIVEAEKQIKGVDTERRGIRLDLFISELDDEKVARVYDIEPNNYDLKVIPKRDRYNQALSDTKLLEVNDDFEKLPEYISIWILPTDPFGKGRMIYTVKNVVEEFMDVVYNDGVKRIFLNAKGNKGGNEKLRTLLQYFCNSCEANVTDPDIEKLHSIVTGVKQDKKVGEQYMSWKHVMKYEARLEAELMVEEMKPEIIKELRQKVEQEVRQEVEQEMRQEVRQEVEQEMRQEVRRKVEEEVRNEVHHENILALVKNSINNGVTKEVVADILMKGYSFTEEEAGRWIKEACD